MNGPRRAPRLPRWFPTVWSDLCMRRFLNAVSVEALVRPRQYFRTNTERSAMDVALGGSPGFLEKRPVAMEADKK